MRKLLIATLFMWSAVASAATMAPDILVYRSNTVADFGSGVWINGAEFVPDLEPLEFLYIPQPTIDTAVAHIQSLENPLPALQTGYFPISYGLIVSPEVSEVPLPTSAFLLGSAFLGLSVVARTRRRDA